MGGIGARQRADRRGGSSPRTAERRMHCAAGTSAQLSRAAAF